MLAPIFCGPGCLLSELPYQQAARQLHRSGMVCRNALFAVVTFVPLNASHLRCAGVGLRQRWLRAPPDPEQDRRQACGGALAGARASGGGRRSLQRHVSRTYAALHASRQL
jgi:hypothetical protein